MWPDGLPKRGGNFKAWVTTLLGVPWQMLRIISCEEKLRAIAIVAAGVRYVAVGRRWGWCNRFLVAIVEVVSTALRIMIAIMVVVIQYEVIVLIV